MSELDMATLGILALALFLQALAGMYKLIGVLDAAVLKWYEVTSTLPADRGWTHGGWFQLLYTRREWRESKNEFVRKLHSPSDRKLFKPLKVTGFMEEEARPLFLRQMSLLLVGVVVLVRFAYGEPILKLV